MNMNRNIPLCELCDSVWDPLCAFSHLKGICFYLSSEKAALRGRGRIHTVYSS